jgi:hypothetical protein
MSQKPKPKIARNLSAKTAGAYGFDNGSVAFEKNQYEPDPNCPHCKGSGGVQVGENEYSTCPCVLEKEASRKTKTDGVR